MLIFTYKQYIHPLSSYYVPDRECPIVNLYR